jgi:hypothetical protein
VGQDRLGPSHFFMPLVLGPLNSLVWYVPSLRYTRGLGWRMHCGAEVTESSTNKQHHLSAQGLEIREHVAQLRTNSLNIVTFCKPASVITGGLAPQDVKISRRHRTLKALDMSNLIITSGSEGSELSEAYMAERILAQCEATSWRPAVWRKFSYVDVNILEIGPRTAAAARLARQRRQLSPQMMGRRPTGEQSGFAGFSSAIRRPPAYSFSFLFL